MFTYQKQNHSIKKLHEDLSEHVAWYGRWHNHPHHKKTHWVIFSLFLVLTLNLVYRSALDFTHADEIVIETPVVETPVVETPVVETPVVETPVVETPVVETPVVETPVVETPVVETPVVINQTQPFIKYTTTPIPSGTYKSGVIPVSIVFNEPVVVTGNPQLILAVNNTNEVKADYKGGSGTNSLIFLYKVSSGDNSASFDYSSSSALVLNNNTIKNKEGDDVNLILPNPGSKGSISFNKTIVIDTSF